MIVEDFTVRGKSRYNELQEFMVNHLTEASFRVEPSYRSSTDCYHVSLRYHLMDAIQLEKLHEKWRLEDESKAKNKRTSSFQRILSLFSLTA